MNYASRLFAALVLAVGTASAGAVSIDLGETRNSGAQTTTDGQDTWTLETGSGVTGLKFFRTDSAPTETVVLTIEGGVFGSPFALSAGESFTVEASANSQYTVIVGTASSLTGGAYSLSVTAVPLPAAAWLFGSALLGATLVARRKDRQSDTVLAV